MVGCCGCAVFVREKRMYALPVVRALLLWHENRRGPSGPSTSWRGGSALGPCWRAPCRCIFGRCDGSSIRLVGCNPCNSIVSKWRGPPVPLAQALCFQTCSKFALATRAYYVFACSVSGAVGPLGLALGRLRFRGRDSGCRSLGRGHDAGRVSGDCDFAHAGDVPADTGLEPWASL